jgi:hypothetical protein
VEISALAINICSTILDRSKKSMSKPVTIATIMNLSICEIPSSVGEYRDCRLAGGPKSFRDACHRISLLAG